MMSFALQGLMVLELELELELALALALGGWEGCGP